MTEEQKIGYKVLQLNRKSAVMYGDKGCCYYAKGVEVKPKDGCGPLCIFNSVTKAQAFVDWLTGSHKFIVKCSYKRSKNQYIWDTDTTVDSFYRIPIIDLPSGTILADSVTCLE